MADASSSDRWELELPRTGRGRRAHVNWTKMERIVRKLRKKPALVSGDDGTEYGEDLAALLEAGVEHAKKRGYDWIIVDFW